MLYSSYQFRGAVELCGGGLCSRGMPHDSRIVFGRLSSSSFALNRGSNCSMARSGCLGMNRSMFRFLFSPYWIGRRVVTDFNVY